MLNKGFRVSWLTGGWMAVVAIIVAMSMAMGAKISTTALLLALGVAPGIVIALLAQSAPSPSVADILHSVEKNDRRS